MQLFTVGLLRLHNNGTIMVDGQGNPIPTYDNMDVMTFARAWTGFDVQSTRGNMEARSVPYTNNIDPMKIVAAARDQFPKMDLLNGFIGDGYPLCTDLPSRPFLRKGARYHYLGLKPYPRLVLDPSRYADPNRTDIVRLNLDASTSALHAKLCRPIAATGQCDYLSTVTLDSNLACGGIECSVQTVRVVRLGTGVFYEYEELPCVELEFYPNARTITTYGGAFKDLGAQPRCANPLVAAAGPACCTMAAAAVGAAVGGNADGAARYSGERVTFTENEQRCTAISRTTCSWYG